MPEQMNGQMPPGGAALTPAQANCVALLENLVGVAKQGAFDGVAFVGVGGPYGNLTLSCNPERICEIWMGLDSMKDHIKMSIAQAAQRAQQEAQKRKPQLMRATAMPNLPPFPGK